MWKSKNRDNGWPLFTRPNIWAYHFFLTKLGHSNSAVDLFFEGEDQLLQKKGVISKKKKRVITCLAARFVSFLGRK